MSMQGIVWPIKTRELNTQLYDSTVWNDFQFRDDDIVISTWAKSGTTWTQQIVAQLLFNGAEDLEVAEMSPWLDLRMPPKEVKLTRHWKRRLTDASSRRICRWMPSCIHQGRNTSISAVTGVTSCGACTITGSMQRHDLCRNQRHARTDRAAVRTAACFAQGVFSHVAGTRRLPIFIILGKRPIMVGDPPSAKPVAAALRAAPG